MRISDWSSDVCSSDLKRRPIRPDSTIGPIQFCQIARYALIQLFPANLHLAAREVAVPAVRRFELAAVDRDDRMREDLDLPAQRKIGRASCRERVCQYV